MLFWVERDSELGAHTRAATTTRGVTLHAQWVPASEVAHPAPYAAVKQLHERSAACMAAWTSRIQYKVGRELPIPFRGRLEVCDILAIFGIWHQHIGDDSGPYP